MSGFNNIEAIPESGLAASGAGKRKGVRKGSTAAPGPASKKAAEEILFKDEPNPYRQPVAPYIWIDYPRANERLKSPEYAVRIGAGGVQALDICIDKGPWIPCRATSGYWWYDWSGIAPGKHTLVARMRTPDGRRYRTPVRTCEYR